MRSNRLRDRPGLSHEASVPGRSVLRLSKLRSGRFFRDAVRIALYSAR